MATREELAKDQQVVVYMAYSGRAQLGWVVKVANKYVTITTNRMTGGHAREFDIATQNTRGEASHGLFRTMEQEEARQRNLAARQQLRELGVSVSFGGPTSKGVLSTEEMEAIVELIRRMRGAKGPSLPG